jgi:molybdopterin/thiamine biosynthesis adenylyltransferase
MRSTSVAVIGNGGLGSPLILHLTLLAVRKITPIDPQELDETNRNRFIGARHTDSVPGTQKVMISDRLIREIDPQVDCDPIPKGLVSEECLAAVRAADWVFGCLDHDGPPVVSNELAAAYGNPYVDLASDVPESGIYGGLVCVSINGDGCLDCLDLLGKQAVRRYLESPEQRQAEDKIYGITRDALEVKGPSVSPLNGVIAALAAMEFMAAVSGLRPPTRLQEYRGHLSKVVISADKPRSGCPRCLGLWKIGREADVERHLRIPHLRE